VSQTTRTPVEPDSSGIQLDELERLHPRYAGPGPRYTSYPTAPMWTEEFDRHDHEAALRGLDPKQEFSAYVHVPFCRSLCHFCACNRVITQDPALPTRYLEAIEEELQITANFLEATPRIGQLHWGGGTPTHLDAGQIERLFMSIDAHVDFLPGAERSIEIDPRVTTHDQIETLAGLGFNRISMGVQDTHPQTQAAIHRIQPFEQTLGLTELARSAGIAGVNYDLVYGLPHQSEESMQRTVNQILEARPDRIALYGYAHVTWVAKQQRGFNRGDLPDASRRLALLLEASGRLMDAGYRWIGMDHFATADDELSIAFDEGSLRRNFMGYTTRAGTNVLAFGPSAISQLGGSFAQADKMLGGWSEKVLAGQLATVRGHRLTSEDHARRFVIEEIMCAGRVSALDVLRRFGEAFLDAYIRDLDQLSDLVEDGLIKITPSRDLIVQPTGRVFLRNVAMAFDAYLPKETGNGEWNRPVFSQTI
jgi:oxygen-independent coproporphyrinogen III oxidase